MAEAVADRDAARSNEAGLEHPDDLAPRVCSGFAGAAVFDPDRMGGHGVLVAGRSLLQHSRSMLEGAEIGYLDSISDAAS